MTPRTYSNIAVETTLSGGITNVAPTLVVADATGYPTAPFAIVVDSGAATEEVLLVTNKAGTTFTVTRGYDGSSASAHANGATVIHAAIADDFRGMQLGTRDVATTAPSDTNALVWSAANSRWQPGAAAGSTKALSTVVVGSSTWTGYADYTCDGTDDQVQIQAALDALGATGGTVVLTNGTFTVAQGGTATGDALTQPYCIRVSTSHGPIRIVGAGRDVTTIKLANNQVSNCIPLLIRASSAAKRTAFTEVTQLSIDGNVSGQVAAWTDFGVLEVAYSDNGVIEDVYIGPTSPYTCCQIFRDSQYWAVMNARFDHGPNGNALRIEVPGVRVIGCHFKGNTALGLRSSLDLATNNDIGVVGQHFVIIGNTFDDGYQQLVCNGVRNSTIIGNTFRNVLNVNGTALVLAAYNAGPGYDCLENVVADNTFYNIRNGITLTGTGAIGGKRNIVTHNTIIEAAGVNLNVGIQEAGGTACDANIIAENIIIGANTTISVVGASTVVRDNPGFTSNNDSLQRGNNLSDVANTTTARTNIGAGTVSSVAMTVPADLSVAGSPISGTGTLAVTRNTQSANQFLGGPASGSAATPAYRALQAADLPDYHQYVYYNEDFIINTPSGTSISGTGATITLNSAAISDNGGFPGWGSFQTGTASNGRAVACPPGTVAHTLLGNGAWVFETLINLPILSDGTDTYTVRAGWNDSTTAAGLDAVMFSYTNGASSGDWECITRSNNNQTLTDSTINVVAATNYKLRIEINAAASTVLFFINGTQRASHNTNIPTGAGRQTMPLFGIIKSLGGNSRELLVDYLHYECALTSAR